MLWVEKVVLLLKVIAYKGSEHADFAYIHFKECNESLGKVDKVLGCICV